MRRLPPTPKCDESEKFFGTHNGIEHVEIFTFFVYRNDLEPLKYQVHPVARPDDAPPSLRTFRPRGVA